MRFRDGSIVLAVCGALLIAGPVGAERKGTAPQSQKKPAPQQPRKSGSLGTKDPGLFNLTGSIYFLDQDTGGMPPDLRVRKVQGTVYTDRIDVPVRTFTEGFPGVTDRFEWFGIVYTGRFFVEVPGSYLWTLQSDDGSRLWIDGKEVIDNDGVHGFSPKEGRVNLTAGAHDMKLWYYQGPATEIGLQMFVTAPKGTKRVFDLSDYAGPMASAIKTLKAEATPDGIKVRLDAALLFDTAKWDLKPRAQQAIKNLSQLMAAYPSPASGSSASPTRWAATSTTWISRARAPSR